jgi:hypothetical protein
LPLKDLVCGPVCWAKMVHFWKPWKQAFWPPPECREPFNVLPRHALSSFMDWNGGVGPWWAATASKKHQALVSASEHKLIRQTMPDELFNKTQPIRLTREGCQLCRQIFEWLNLVYFINRAQQNNRDPKRFSGWCLILNRTIPCQKGGPKPDLHPRPPDLHQNVPNFIANTPGKLLAPEGSFWKSTFWQGFPPCPPGHLPPQTECAGVLTYI